MNTTRLLVCASLCAILGISNLPQAQAQFTYTFFPDDGTLASTVNTDFAIVGFAGGSYDDSFNRNFLFPSSPTLHVVNGADIGGEMDIFNSSHVIFSGGNIGFINVFDNSSVSASGGSSPFLLAFDSSTVNMSDGIIDDLEGQGSSVTVSGGHITSKLVANSAADSVTGNPIGSCIIDVTGGSIEGELDAYNNGLLNLHGGQLGGDLFAAFGGTIDVYGSGLTASLVNPDYNNAYSLYSLSGTLEDGTVLSNKNLFIMNDGVTYGHSSFNLISAASTPEPNSLILLLSGGLGAGLLLHRRRHVLAKAEKDRP